MDICAMASFIHALLSFVLHGQAQHVRPRIVAAHVELHAARGHALHIKVGIEDVLPVPHRLHDIVPIRVDDAAAAAAGDIAQARELFGTVQPGWVIRAVKDHVAIDEIAPALERDVLHGGLPLGVVIRVRRDVERHALFIQRRACQRHIALPADEAAHRAPRRVHDREIPAVGVAPDHALCPGGLELAVHGRERAVRAEDEVGIVERAGHTVALRYTDAHVCARGLCRRGEALRLRAGHDDGVVAVQLPVLVP